MGKKFRYKTILDKKRLGIPLGDYLHIAGIHALISINKSKQIELETFLFQILGQLFTIPNDKKYYDIR